MKQTNTPKYTIDEILVNFDKTGKMPRAILDAFIVYDYYLHLNIELLSESDVKRIQQLDRDFAYYDTEKNYAYYTYTFSIDKREFEVIASRDVNYNWHYGDNDEDNVEVHEIDLSSDEDEIDTSSDEPDVSSDISNEPKYTIKGILANFDKTKTMPREILDTFVVCEDYDEELLSDSDANRICQHYRDITEHDIEKNYTDYLYIFTIDKRKFEVSVGIDANYDSHFGWGDEDDVEVSEVIEDKNSISITFTRDQVKVLLECCKDPAITRLLKNAISDDSDDDSDEDDCDDDDEWDEEEEDEDEDYDEEDDK